MSFGRATRKPYDRPQARSRADADRWVHDKAPNGVLSSPKPTASAEPNSTVVVKNLHYNVTPKDLISIFGQVGTLVREPTIKVWFDPTPNTPVLSAYDRSGRSTGVAFVHYETVTEATKAIKQFDGVLAKGEPMSLSYDSRPVGGKRSGSAPPSLADRIAKPSLIERLAGGKVPNSGNVVKQAINTAPAQSGLGPTRNHGPRKQAVRPPRGKKEHKTAEDLDKELEDFMNVD